MRTLFILLAALSLPASGASSPAEMAQAMSWSWDEGEVRRWTIENEVTLPQSMWFLAEHNRQARVVAWQIELVVACQAAEQRRRLAVIHCDIEDVALRAAAIPSDEGKLQPILDELREKLLTGRLTFTQRPDGRLGTVDLEGIEAGRDRRIAQSNQNLRLVVLRAMAGLDLELPRRGTTEAGVWAQHESLLMTAPSALGTQGGIQLVHRAQSLKDGHVVVETVGRGMLMPGTHDDAVTNLFDTRLESVSAFHLEEGWLRERFWTAIGEPTASSALAEGSRGLVYTQRGRLGATVDGHELGPTTEIAPPGRTPSALEHWQPFGYDPVSPAGR